MPRTARIRIVRNNRSRLLLWTLDIPAAHSATGERQRVGYATRSEADRARLEEDRRLTRYSEQSFGLTDAQKVEAAECFAVVAPFSGRTLREAAHFAARAWAAEAASIGLADLGAEFVRGRGEDGREALYRDKVAWLLKRLAKALPAGTRASAVTPVTLDGWLRSLPIGPVSRNNYLRHLSAAFGLAVERGWCALNPCAKVATAREPDAPVSILTPAETRALLTVAHPDIVGWLALGLFAGLRPTEAERLAWADIHPDRIQIHAAKSKSRKVRWAPVIDPLPSWLSRASRERKDGTVGYSRERREQAARDAGVTWKMDILRHTFGTMRGLILNDEGKLAAEMGNSPQMIFRHYRHGHATPEQAREFFSITP